MRLSILPIDIDLKNGSSGILGHTLIVRGIVRGIGQTGGTKLGGTYLQYEYSLTHMDQSVPIPQALLQLVHNDHTDQRLHYLNHNVNCSALQIDGKHGMSLLHMIAMNPHAPVDTIAALFDSNMDDVFCSNYQVKTPLEYARYYNVGGLIGMIAGLCNYKNSSILIERDIYHEIVAKRRKIE